MNKVTFTLFLEEKLSLTLKPSTHSLLSSLEEENFVGELTYFRSMSDIQATLDKKKTMLCLFVGSSQANFEEIPFLFESCKETQFKTLILMSENEEAKVQEDIKTDYLFHPWSEVEYQWRIKSNLLELKEKAIERENHRSAFVAYEKIIESDRYRALGKMGTGIAHELNQPLVGVRGLAEHILIAFERDWEISRESICEKMQLIVEQADRMTKTIKHIRQFAQEAGGQHEEWTSLQDVIKNSLTFIQAQFRVKGILLNTYFEDPSFKIFINPYRLEEALLNILTNARDAVLHRMEKREKDYVPLVEVYLREEEIEEEKVAHIEVIDHGGGMEASTLKQVCEPFFSTKNNEHAPGLGLTIAKSIIEQRKGSLFIESAIGRGTKVKVSFSKPDKPLGDENENTYHR